MRGEPHEYAQIKWLRGLGYGRAEIARFFEIHPTMVSKVVKIATSASA